MKKNTINNIFDTYNTMDCDGEFFLSTKDMSKFSHIIKVKFSQYKSLSSPEKSDFYDGIESTSNILGHNNSGIAKSVSRIVFDSPNNLPHEEYLQGRPEILRANGATVAEWCRIASEEGVSPKQTLKHFLLSYLVFKACAIDTVFFITDQKKTRICRRLIGTKIISPDLGNKFGGQKTFAAFEWKISETPTQMLFKTIGISKSQAAILENLISKTPQ